MKLKHLPSCADVLLETNNKKCHETYVSVCLSMGIGSFKKISYRYSGKISGAALSRCGIQLVEKEGRNDLKPGYIYEKVSMLRPIY